MLLSAVREFGNSHVGGPASQAMCVLLDDGRLALRYWLRLGLLPFICGEGAFRPSFTKAREDDSALPWVGTERYD